MAESGSSVDQEMLLSVQSPSGTPSASASAPFDKPCEEPVAAATSPSDPLIHDPVSGGGFDSAATPVLGGLDDSLIASLMNISIENIAPISGTLGESDVLNLDRWNAHGFSLDLFPDLDPSPSVEIPGPDGASASTAHAVEGGRPETGSSKVFFFHFSDFRHEFC